MIARKMDVNDQSCQVNIYDDIKLICTNVVSYFVGILLIRKY